MKITFKSILIGLGALAAFAGFAMMFFAPLETIVKNLVTDEITVVGQIDWQNVYLPTIEGEPNPGPHTLLPMIGYILMALGGLAGLAVAGLGRKPKVYLNALILAIVTTILIAAGAALVYMTETLYLAELGIEPDSALDLVQTTVYPLIGSGVGIGGAALILIGSFIPGPHKK